MRSQTASRKVGDVIPARVSVGFSAAAQARLDALAKQYDRSVPYIVRKAVKHYLADVSEHQLGLDLGSLDER